MKFLLKLPRGSVLLLLIVLLLTLALEQAYALPVLTLMILFVQQPLLNDLESCVLAGVIGLLFAVVFHLPLALGVGLLLLVVGLSRTVLQHVHVQARDAFLTLGACAVLAWGMHARVTGVLLGQFLVYFLGVVIVLRLWISRRSYHAKRTKTSS